jgi:hypothetical protein
MKIPDILHSFNKDPIVSMYSDADMGLIVGTSGGKLLRYNQGVFTLLSGKGKRPIDGIFGSEKSDLILFDDEYIRAYHKPTGKILNIVGYSLKDAVILSDREFYFGTNNGILKCIWDKKEGFRLEPLKDLSFRIYALEFNPKDSCLYAATSNGFVCISLSGQTKKIKNNGQDIFPNALDCHGGKIYAIDKNNSILTIEQGEIIKTTLPLVGGKTKSIGKLKVLEHAFIVKSSDGFYQFDKEGKLLRNLHSTFSFPSRRLMDFTLHGNDLWVSHSGGIQMIELHSAKTNSFVPPIRFDKIYASNEAVNNWQAKELNSGQRKMQFIFSSPTLKNREIIRYFYKLDGYDRDWTISGPESNNIVYNALAAGTYTFNVKAEYEGVFSKTISYSFTINAPFYQHWWFIGFSILLFLSAILTLYKWRLRVQQNKSQRINELNASKLTAIQSQMNPHFIFNSLNSIQDLVLKGDIDNSYSFITKFSNLVRRTLSYSEKEFIDFDQELKLIELYLSLEKLRFKESLHYTIETNGIEDIQVPPMLIQPFIENALLHGLLHKTGTKKLSVNFELKDVLICEITDNGVGRVKSREIKVRQRSDHESFSENAIKKRFEILERHFGGKFGFTYVDLEENGEVQGTKVILKIPVRHKY